MIRVAPLHDMELVRKTLTTDDIWAAMTDDGWNLESYYPQEKDGFIYMGVWDDDEFLGLGFVQQLNAIMAETHIFMLPNGRGLRAVEATKRAFEWIWANTPAKRVITCVPTCNKAGMAFAGLTGYEQFGVNPAAWLKNGKLYDIVLFGVTHG